MDDGSAFGCLSHHQGSSGSQLIRNPYLRDPKPETEQVWIAAQILQPRHTGNPNGDADRTIAPGAPVGINDQNADLFTCLGLNLLAKICCRAVGVRREQEHPFFIICFATGRFAICIGKRGHDVRVIDSRIGANEAKAVFYNDRSRPYAQNFLAFAQDQLYEPRVFFCFFRKRYCSW